DVSTDRAVDDCQRRGIRVAVVVNAAANIAGRTIPANGAVRECKRARVEDTATKTVRPVGNRQSGNGDRPSGTNREDAEGRSAAALNRERIRAGTIDVH